jgi:hypothetical protein
LTRPVTGPTALGLTLQRDTTCARKIIVHHGTLARPGPHPRAIPPAPQQRIGARCTLQRPYRPAPPLQQHRARALAPPLDAPAACPLPVPPPPPPPPLMACSSSAIPTTTSSSSTMRPSIPRRTPRTAPSPTLPFDVWAMTV